MATSVGRSDETSPRQQYRQAPDGPTHQIPLNHIPAASRVNERSHTQYHDISNHIQISHEGTGIHDGTYYPDGVTLGPSEDATDSCTTSEYGDTEPEVQQEPTFIPIGGTEDTTGLSTQDESYINPEGRAEIHSIATRTQSFRISQTRSNKPIGSVSDLERQDTLAGVEIGNPVLDPNSPEFDIYKWVRMFVKLLQEEDIKSRRAGFTFKNLDVSGSGNALQLQKDVPEPFMVPFRLNEYVSFGKKTEKQILPNFQGTLGSGQMLIVLGRPGSGCSTFLKTICGEHHGLNIQKGSEIHYNGIPQDRVMEKFKGDVVYNQEVDKHFPHLTVWETLTFAASARTPQRRVKGLTREQHIEHITSVIMNIFGLRHTKNTKVGNDYIRGVSGGEHKRVSIAEMALAVSPIAAWDNSTRGLDAASALEFTKALKVSAKVAGMCHAVAIYQASQAIYDLFDKVIVLYEGRQIYYGPTDRAKRYFEEMGWHCPPRQTTGDFLTSVTNPSERQEREGYENRVPRTPDEFEKYWQASDDYAALQREIERTEQEFPIGQDALAEFEQSHRQMQAKHTRPGSPYATSIFMQVRLCIKRFYQRTWNDKASTLTSAISNIVMALIIGSIFYGTQDNTSSFYSRGSVLFFAVLLNALMAINEINSLYAQRPIVEKQASYAFYHPFAEGLAGIIADIPIKFFPATFFNIILYFMAGLRRTPSQFFIFFLFNFMAQLCMTCIFRTLAAATKTISAAMSYAGVFVLAIVIYTGFTLPGPYVDLVEGAT
ncbi:hypothetical protein H2199_008800 [Coniosporium tulheliwenetii]|uniref:Uncharacterized protein n=1 Tax=Coniosporium tulheliwenetii TaxID=3383036 RepID=A0ACC2YI57_9PEZI|nr:hypothetical protein H2199_008800 [Cladosporium sp. JES 115]